MRFILFIIKWLTYVVLSMFSFFASSILFHVIITLINPRINANIDCWGITCIGLLDISKNYNNIIMAQFTDVFLYNFIINAIIGLSFGIIQWLAFRKHGVSMIKWLIYTVVGFELSCWIIIVYELIFLFNKDISNLHVNHSYLDIFIFCLCIVASFISLGFCQWILLRNIFKRSSLWILATSLGCFLSWEITWQDNNYLLPVGHFFEKTRNFNFFIDEILMKSTLDKLPYDAGTSIIYGFTLGLFIGFVYAYFTRYDISHPNMLS